MSGDRKLPRLEDLEALAVWEGVRARRVIGQRCMFAWSSSIRTQPFRSTATRTNNWASC